MNSLKRHKQANKTKDTIIMTKYNIVKIFQRRLPPEKSGIRAMLFPCVCGQKYRDQYGRRDSEQGECLGCCGGAA